MDIVMKKSKVLARKSALKFGGKPEDYVDIHRWFLEPIHWVGEENYHFFRHHSQGIFVAEKKFGIVIENHSGKKIPTRVIAEHHVVSVLGFISTAYEIIEKMEIQKWMGLRNRHVNRAGKDSRIRKKAAK